MTQEKIVCAAVKHNGKIWFGHRHYGALRAMQDELSWYMSRAELSEVKAQQGFFTTHSRFVDRVEGLSIAINAGQYRTFDGCAETQKYAELFSEDLY